MRGPVLVNGLAGGLYLAAERQGGLADHRVAAHAVKHSNLVPVSQESLPALMIQDDDIIAICLNIVSHHLRAAFTESLDDFSGLWTCSAVCLTAKTSAGPSTGPTHFPRLAVSDKHSCFVLCGGRLLVVLGSPNGNEYR